MSYNRPDIIEAIIRRVNSFSEGYRQNIAIIGEPSIGKTSLIKDILSSEQIKKESIIPIYLEIKIEPFEFCAKRFIKSALFQLMRSDPTLTAPHDTVLLIEDLKRTHPKTAETCIRVLQDIDKGRLDEGHSFMLDITAMISEESKKRCLLILDEFHNLGNFDLKHPYATLAKKIMLQKDTMYLLLSSKATISQRIFSEKLALLFGNFEKMILSPFDMNMSRSFLQDKMRGVTLPQVYMDFVATFTGNKPFYMQVLCDEMEKGVFSRKISPDSYTELIEFALTESVFKKTGVINQLFSNLFFRISDGKLLSKTAALLIALSSGNKKQADMAASSRLQARDASKILSRLADMDIIVRNGSFYRFKDRLFSFWLQSVYLKRILSFSLDELLEEGYFKKDIRTKISMFLQEFEKELSSRVVDLFRLFKNDVIQLNGKKHKFLSFTDVERSSTEVPGNINILAANNRFKWLCTIKKEHVTETEITEIIKNTKTKSRANRINRNILISLAGINENAYLMAKDAKLWVWNMEDLNVLMELYEKPQVG
ncbi:MAG: ATP-binding protein [Candidatus Gorgyraea atricola]|nr:ATP-binding protein [Candidatus Gorgyraea atricola]